MSVLLQLNEKETMRISLGAIWWIFRRRLLSSLQRLYVVGFQYAFLNFQVLEFLNNMGLQGTGFGP
ncbi:hypothetical protein CKAN_00867300 [Cinnamomum micranthum f. kanehirae]|uniref:Uncharacterized protein n=1 Tax=Cinnamomum micranthum f. kanehirae TaxID=337451 RepID=A0A3S4NPY8_9MAGN|nr:hypothetical protein CKAN_00867300 [Cinnamomum micranthum f. kanehirae]